ncbi:MAG: hypothetical protein K2K64_09445 [Muribaculaceae bacterium]|nr:hypothetical protein [Muribaculaceae bacterium]
MVLTVNAEIFNYHFKSLSLPNAIHKIMEDHPSLDINFIYNELENYHTNATIHADNPYQALLQTIGLNPVTVTESKNTFVFRTPLWRLVITVPFQTGNN